MQKGANATDFIKINSKFHFIWKNKILSRYLLHCNNYFFSKERKSLQSDFMVWTFCGKKQFPHSFGQRPKLCENRAFPQNFHTRKLGEITIFYAVEEKGKEEKGKHI